MMMMMMKLQQWQQHHRHVQGHLHQTSQIQSSIYIQISHIIIPQKKNPPSIIINLHLPFPKVPTEMPSPATSVVEHTVATIEAVSSRCPPSFGYPEVSFPFLGTRCIETLPTTWELHVPKRFQSSAAEMMPKMKRKESVSAPKNPTGKSPWRNGRNGGGSDRGRDGGIFSAAGAEFQLWCGRQRGGVTEWLSGLWVFVLGVLGKLMRVYADADLEPGDKTTLYIHSTQ